MKKAQIGMVGLAVMGENLAMNMESHGFTVAVYDVRPGVVEHFMQGRGAGKGFIGAHSWQELADSLQPPRKVMLMIRAGEPVDQVIAQLLPVLAAGDTIIDGGNSHFPDTIRRAQYVESQGLYYLGTGVSGGEEGALHGPSMMPGGSRAAWEQVKDIFQAICAHVDGQPCCDYVGQDGAGHFVKMVHNGIEYGDMQLICEAYQLMRDALGMSADEMQAVFAAWNKTELDSYLIQITADILGKRDQDGAPLVERILDAAGQKGTGKWTAIAALEEGVPLTLISEAVAARSLSAMKEERLRAAAAYGREIVRYTGDRAALVQDLRQALYASKIVSYAQGYALMRDAARHYGWTLNDGGIALMWRGGCIIRSIFLNDIAAAFEQAGKPQHLLLAPYFSNEMKQLLSGWKHLVAQAMKEELPVPAFSSALNYFYSLVSAKLPANMIQAQRDYFGAHTFERVDELRGLFFHENWTGHGGDTKSGTYNV